MYDANIDVPALDSEPSARGKGESPTDIEPQLFGALLSLIEEADEIKNWHETWREDTNAFQRGEFHDRIYAPLFVAYSIIDEEVVELAYRYNLEIGEIDKMSKYFLIGGFKNKVTEISDLLTQDEKRHILNAWQHRNELVHSIHSRFGVRLRSIDFERLSKQLLFAIMKLRTLNSYVNSVRYRPGIEDPETAVSHQMGDNDLKDAVKAAQKVIQDERYFQPRFIMRD
jgi:hypothetical protein